MDVNFDVTSNRASNLMPYIFVSKQTLRSALRTAQTIFFLVRVCLALSNGYLTADISQ
jgi:hypothetical protein